MSQTLAHQVGCTCLSGAAGGPWKQPPRRRSQLVSFPRSPWLPETHSCPGPPETNPTPVLPGGVTLRGRAYSSPKASGVTARARSGCWPACVLPGGQFTSCGRDLCREDRPLSKGAPSWPPALARPCLPASPHQVLPYPRRVPPRSSLCLWNPPSSCEESPSVRQCLSPRVALGHRSQALPDNSRPQCAVLEAEVRLTLDFSVRPLRIGRTSFAGLLWKTTASTQAVLLTSGENPTGSSRGWGSRLSTLRGDFDLEGASRDRGAPSMWGCSAWLVPGC